MEKSYIKNSPKKNNYSRPVLYELLRSDGSTHWRISQGREDLQGHRGTALAPLVLADWRQPDHDALSFCQLLPTIVWTTFRLLQGDSTVR